MSVIELYIFLLYLTILYNCCGRKRKRKSLVSIEASKVSKNNNFYKKNSTPYILFLSFLAADIKYDKAYCAIKNKMTADVGFTEASRFIMLSATRIIKLCTFIVNKYSNSAFLA